MKSKIIKLIFISIIIFMFAPSLAAAYTGPVEFGFEWVGGFSSNPDVVIGESQLFIRVSKANGAKVKFTFFNTGEKPASICDIYFSDDNPPLIKWDDGEDIDSSSGVSFSEGASPGSLPGGKDYFGKSPDFTADSNSPGTSANGVDKSNEWLDVTFKLNDPSHHKSHDELLDALVASLLAGTFDVGIHVQAIGSNGNSLSFHTGNGGGPEPGPTPIPEPATMLLLGTGLVGIAGTVRRRKKLQK